MTNTNSQPDSIEQRLSELEAFKQEVEETSDRAKLTRRGALAALAGGGVLAAGASSPAKAATWSDSDGDGLLETDAEGIEINSLNTVRIVGEGDLIEDAINDAEAGDGFGEVYITSQYNNPNAEDFPITVGEDTDGDGTLNGTSIYIHGDNGTEIVGENGANIFNIRAEANAPPGVMMENLHLAGGENAIDMRGARFCRLRNITINSPRNHGVNIQDTSSHAANSNTLQNVIVRNPDQDGIRATGRIHGLSLINCKTIGGGFDTRKGLYVDGGSSRTTTTIRVVGGSFEECTEKGAHLKNLRLGYLFDVYFEGNDRGDDNVDIGMKNVSATTIDSCYFNGEDTDSTYNRAALFINDSESIHVRNCAYVHYRNGFIDMSSSNPPQNVDVYRGTHKAVDSTPFFDEAHGLVRSYGVIGAAEGGRDLSTVNGEFVGDMAVDSSGLLGTYQGSGTWQLSDGSTKS